MKTQFYIVLSLKTPSGYSAYGQYFFGDVREAAYDLFERLKGSQDLSAPLHIDLMETADEMPVRIRTICCTLEEMGINSQLIAKEIFRLRTLNDLEV
jgi:hypothetical protein